MALPVLKEIASIPECQYTTAAWMGYDSILIGLLTPVLSGCAGYKIYCSVCVKFGAVYSIVDTCAVWIHMHACMHAGHKVCISLGVCRIDAVWMGYDACIPATW